jgi:hypothetical protein
MGQAEDLVAQRLALQHALLDDASLEFNPEVQ